MGAFRLKLFAFKFGSITSRKSKNFLGNRMSGALTGQVWKIHNKPERFVNPPLITNPQVTAHKQCMKKELITTSQEVAAKMKTIGDIYRKNSYFALYRPADETISDEHEFTIDQVRDSISYDQMIPKDTNHPRHT